MKYLLLSIILLVSCVRTPQQAQKKINRLLEKFPEAATIKTDTVTKEVTVTIPSKPLEKTELDSLLADYCDTLKLSDTITIERFRDRIKERIITRCNEFKDTTVTAPDMQITVRKTAKGIEIFGKCNCIEQTKIVSYKPTFWQMFTEYSTGMGFLCLGWLLLILLVLIKRNGQL